MGLHRGLGHHHLGGDLRVGQVTGDQAESLTNALRYAPGAAVRIVISVEEADRGLAVRIENDRAAGSGPALAGTGRGLVGLRERIQALGGQLIAGETGVGGWSVEARLPGSVRVSR